MVKIEKKNLRINFLTAGQTPRKRMICEVLSGFSQNYDVYEFGALDGLTQYEIDDLAPASGEHSIRTKLKSGEDAVISEAWLSGRLADICSNLQNANSNDITVIGSTRSFGSEQVSAQILHAEIALQQTLEALHIAGQKMGEIVTLPIQLYEGRRVADAEFDAAYASPKNIEALADAAGKLSHCDFIVLGSMAHPLSNLDVVAEASGKPVIHIRKVLAGTLMRTMRNRDRGVISKIEGTSPGWNGKLETLSPRETQVLECVLNGLSNKNIARLLGISHRTVEVHRRNIMGKFGVANARDLLGSLHQSLSSISTLKEL